MIEFAYLQRMREVHVEVVQCVGCEGRTVREPHARERWRLIESIDWSDWLGVDIYVKTKANKGERKRERKRKRKARAKARAKA